MQTASSNRRLKLVAVIAMLAVAISLIVLAMIQGPSMNSPTTSVAQRNAANHQTVESAPKSEKSAAPAKIAATAQYAEPVAFFVSIREEDAIYASPVREDISSMRDKPPENAKPIRIPSGQEMPAVSNWPDMIPELTMFDNDPGPPEEQYDEYTRRHPEAKVYFQSGQLEALKGAPTIYIFRVRKGADMSSWGSMTAREFEACRILVTPRFHDDTTYDPRKRSMYPPDIIGAPGTPGSLPAQASPSKQ